MTTAAATVDHFDTLALDVIDPDPDNRRGDLDPAFAASIAQHGVLMPILVTPTGSGRYQVIVGERRYRAAQAAAHDTIPAVIRSTDDATAIVWQAVENLARVDLLPSRPSGVAAGASFRAVKESGLHCKSADERDWRGVVEGPLQCLVLGIRDPRLD